MLAAAMSLLVAACGDDEDDGESASGTATDSGDLIEGGEMEMAQTSQPDYLDPALSYTVNGWEPMWIVYTPLLTYAHEEGPAQLIPGLAEDLPEVSEDGLTYTLTLRDGLTYSDGQDVVASDFEHTIKRVLNLESGGSAFYLGIEGADEYVKAGDPEGDISGIETDDETGEITITLLEPQGDFSNILAMNFAGLVPSDTPFEDQTTTPPPGVGPYVITESEPNRQFVMERRKDFADLGIEGIPPGHVDKMTISIIKDQGSQTQDVLDNELDYMQDPPTADLKQTVQEQVGEGGTEPQRYQEFTTGSTYYFFMNHRVAPFDDPVVREAVNIGLDKVALARLFAGELAPGCTFLPPGFVGYDEALDTTECPWGDPNAAPDIETARQMLEDAGVAGEKVIVWGNNDDPTDKVTEAYTEQLNDMGFDAESRIIDGGVYFQTVGNQKTEAQTGFTNWFGDYPHPLNFYFLIEGRSIQPTNNQNFGNVDDEFVNEEVAELRLEPDVEAVADRWAALDRYVVENALVAPYGHRKLATFVSERVNFDGIVVHPLYYNDYTSFQLKAEGSE